MKQSDDLTVPQDKPCESLELVERLNNYLGNGGFWNPDLMERDKMRNMIVDVRDFLAAMNEK